MYSISSEDEPLMAEFQAAIAELNTESLPPSHRDLFQQFNYILAAKRNISKAVDRLKNSIEFFNTTNVFGTQEDEVGDSLMSGKVVIHGKDRENRPCVVMRLCRHDNSVSSEENLRFLCYMVTTLFVKLTEAQCFDAHLIIDAKDFTRHNLDLDFVKTALGILQDHFPGRIFRLHIVNANFLIRTVFRGLKMFLNILLKERIELSKSATGELAQFFDPSELLVNFEGTVELFNETGHPTGFEFRHIE
ncbi:hypothetical protein PCE1_000369 [Barthelona sp. PCE]